MEEFNDDDFSDLYAEVEVQASSAIGAMHGLTEMPPEHHGNFGNAIDVSPQSPGDVDESSENVRIEFGETESATGNDGIDEEEEEECDDGLTKLPLENGDIYESESEDDFNIVLDGGDDGKRQKNEGCYGNSNINSYNNNNNNNNNNNKEFGAYEKKNGGGIYGKDNCFTSGDYDSQRKYMGPQSVAPSSSLKGNGPTKADWEESGRASNFSLPRSRTILDVNIDSLERKPWRHPRSDITDFFNFGFDEDGWKHYCNDMDKCRGQKIMANWKPAPEFPRRTKPRGGSLSQNYVGKHQPSSHGRHSVDQDSDAVIQDLKDDSRNSNKKTADHIVNQVHERSKNGDSDADADRVRPCFSSASEDDPPSLRRNEDQRVKFTSERDSRHTPIHASVALDLDKYGTVQISDSEEDNHQVLDYESDGVAQTSENMNKKNTSNMSNKASSAVEPESSHSGRSPHGLDFSCSPSPRAALRNNDRKKSHEQSKKYSSSKVWELPQSAISDYLPSKESKHCGVSTKDDNCCKRDRGPFRKDLKTCKRPRRVPNLKTHPNDEDESDMFDARGLNGMYKSMTSRRKQRAMPHFDSNEKDMPYCKGSESLFPYFGGLVPDSQWDPAYLKDQYWNIHPRLRCEAGWGDGHSMIKNVNSFEKKRTMMIYDDSEDFWYHNEKRRAISDMNPLNFEDSRKALPKYSPDNRRRNQFSKRVDGLHFRRKVGGYNLASPHDYHNNVVKGKYRRYMLSSDRDRRHFDHIYDCNMLRDGKEIESPTRDNRRHDSLRENSNYSRHIKNDENRRCVKHRPLPFHSYEERHAPSRGRFQGATALKFVAPERHRRSSWKDRHRESGWCGTNNLFFDTSDGLRSDHGKDHHDRRRRYQQSTNTSNRNEYIEHHHDWDHFVRRKNHEHSEVVQWSEEEYKSGHPVDTSDYEGPSYHLERISRNNVLEAEHASDHVADYKREVDRYRYELKREGDCSNKFDQSPNVIPPYSHVQIHPRHRYSVDRRLVVVGGKSSRRTSEAEDPAYYGRSDIMEWSNERELKSYEDIHDFYSENVLAREGKVECKQSDKIWHHKFSNNQQNEFLGIEEGQIITEEINEKPLQCWITPENATQINEVEHLALNGDRVVERLDDQRIQEIKAKMERRRERFTNSITSNKDSENSKQSADLDVETVDYKIERPTRKRRWIGG